MTGQHITSIQDNPKTFRELLESSETKLHPTLADSYATFAAGVGWALLRAVEGTRDTALHLIATYSTKEEFAGIMNALALATEAAKPWDNFCINYDLSQLFGLQNRNGETVLHRAAAMSNFGVVSSAPRSPRA